MQVDSSTLALHLWPPESMEGVPEPPPQPAGKAGSKKSPAPDVHVIRGVGKTNRPAVLPLAREGAAWGGGPAQPQELGTDALNLLYAHLAVEYAPIFIRLGGYCTLI